MTAVCDGLLVGLQSLRLYGRYGLRSDIQHQRVDELDVIAASWLGARLKRGSEIGDECNGRARFQVCVQLLRRGQRTDKYK